MPTYAKCMVELESVRAARTSVNIKEAYTMLHGECVVGMWAPNTDARERTNWYRERAVVPNTNSLFSWLTVIDQDAS